MELPVEFGSGLRGVLHLPDGAKRCPMVVALHGFTGNKVEEGRLFVRLGRALSGFGIGCLRFDFRGSGDSSGDFEEMTLSSEVQDARSALVWLRNQPAADPARVGLLGLSLGSVVASEIAAVEQVAALVLWATISDPSSVFGTDLGAASRGYRPSQIFFEQMRQASPLVSLARYPGPLLCVHGQADFVPLEQAERACQAAQGRLHVVEGGGHSFGRYDKQREAIEVSCQFFAGTLAASSNATSTGTAS